MIETAQVPPREKIVKSGLSIGRDIESRANNPIRLERKAMEASIRVQTHGLRDTPYIGALASGYQDPRDTQAREKMNTSFDLAEKSKNPKEQLKYSLQ